MIAGNRQHEVVEPHVWASEGCCQNCHCFTGDKYFIFHQAGIFMLNGKNNGIEQRCLVTWDAHSSDDCYAIIWPIRLRELL